VEAEATSYVREINAMYPEGAVHLLGHSFGGWVAVEMAHQLRIMNRAVASLTVIDSEVPGDDAAIGREYSSIEVFSRLTEILEMSAQTSLGIDSSELESLDESGQLELLHQRMVHVGLIRRNTRAELLRGVVSTFGAALRTNYRPGQLYPGPLRLVLVSDGLLDEDADRRQQEAILEGWRQWAPNLKGWHASGNHMTVLRTPHVEALANWWLANLTTVGKEA
jgi:thioesterase domain-containing protein